jgi:hypothetical protein
MKLIKIGPVGAELFHADGRTDKQTVMTKLIVPFEMLPTRLKKELAACYTLRHN